ncbi:unnamed protein product [Ilex paraguariensis]|uniref:Odorant receptor n=1 Tax=Ilex paraguariensis TaxID=185542 RepID=A0ABC8V331_9AQUA
MRLKYPHIAIGALAALAPVLQFEDLVPAETYYDIVSNDFKCETMSCFNTIKDSWDAITYEGQKNDGLQLLSKMFRLCRWFIDSDSIKDEFREPEKAEDLSDWLESAYNFLAMTDYPYPTDFVMPLPGNPINEVSEDWVYHFKTCLEALTKWIYVVLFLFLTFLWSILISLFLSFDDCFCCCQVCIKIDSCSDRTSILERIFEGISVYYNYTGAVDCFDLDDDPHGTDGWIWQFLLRNTVIARTQACFVHMIIITLLTKSGARRNSVSNQGQHGSLQNLGFKSALKLFGSKIIFSNGLLDPCSGGSVLEDVSETIVALTENAFWLNYAIGHSNTAFYTSSFLESATHPHFLKVLHILISVDKNCIATLCMLEDENHRTCLVTHWAM